MCKLRFIVAVKNKRVTLVGYFYCYYYYYKKATK